MEAKKAAARRRFDRWARTYERDRRSRFIAKPQEEALAALALQPSDRFLDVGCGTGAAVRTAAASVERAVGADISPEMVRRAAELAAGLPNAEFVVADSEQLPFAAGAFTAVLCSSSLHHYPDPQRALAEMARVLAGGGRSRSPTRRAIDSPHASPTASCAGSTAATSASFGRISWSARPRDRLRRNRRHPALERRLRDRHRALGVRLTRGNASAGSAPRLIVRSDKSDRSTGMPITGHIAA